jgi:hypothetical protein
MQCIVITTLHALTFDRSSQDNHHSEVDRYIMIRMILDFTCNVTFSVQNEAKVRTMSERQNGAQI